jgi:uncharacterized protein
MSALKVSLTLQRTLRVCVVLYALPLLAQDFPTDAQIKMQSSTLPSAVRAMQLKTDVPLSATANVANTQATPVAPSLPNAKVSGPIKLLGTVIPAGTRARLSWKSSAMGFNDVGAPVVVINGKQAGPVLCLTGGVHGDELNGVEVINRIARKLDPKTLSGSVIAVPVVNVSGFQRNSRYLPDRRDLNRFFPGYPEGSAASRLAHDFFHSIVVGCDYLIDFHTGSFERSNLPQVRGNLRLREVLEFTRNFGATTVLHSRGARGMLRTAATDAGIPAVTFEIGAPVRLEQKEIEFGVQALDTLLSKLKMTQRLRVWSAPQPVLYRATWLRSNQAGLLISKVSLGDRVKAGEVLGMVRDPLSGSEAPVITPQPGKIIGLALNQQVMPGYAVYHLGVESSESDVVINAMKPRLLSRDEEDVEADEPSLEEDVEESVEG